MRSSLRNLRSRWPAVVALLLGASLLALLFPYGASAYHVEVGGRALERAQSSFPDTSAELGRAITHLETALQWRGDNAQAYRLLSHAYTTKGDLARAEQALIDYTVLRPHNPLGWAELVQLYARADGQSFSPSRLSRAVAAWRKGGFDLDDATGALREAWREGQHAEVVSWYRLAMAEYGDLPSPARFYGAVAAAAMSEGVLVDANGDLAVYGLQGHARIEGEALQWQEAKPGYDIEAGDPLGDPPETPEQAGVFWWADSAVAGVQVSEAGDYRIVVRARHQAAAPGRLILEWDLAPLGEFEVGEAWTEVSVSQPLSSGLHLLGIRYPADEGDLIVDWVLFERVAD